jgi:hypothetical protein
LIEGKNKKMVAKRANFLVKQQVLNGVIGVGKLKLKACLQYFNT